MMHDFEGKGLWKTVFANRLRVFVLAERGQWGEAYGITKDFLSSLNRFERLDDEELLLVCLLASVVNTQTEEYSPMITGEIEERNIVAARSLLLALRELQGQNSHAELLELAQKYPASIALNIYEVMYMDHYSPETDAFGIGFLCWQARQQRVRIRTCQPMNWLESQVQDRSAV